MAAWLARIPKLTLLGLVILLVGFAPEILAIGEKDIFWHYPHGSEDHPTIFSLDQRITLQVDMAQGVQEGDVASVSCDITRFDWIGEHEEYNDLELTASQGVLSWTRYYVLTKEGKWKFVFTVVGSDGKTFTRTGWGQVGEGDGLPLDLTLYDWIKVVGGALIVIGLITRK